MANNTAETRNQIVRSILGNTGYDMDLAEFIEALAPYFGTVYSIDPDRRHIECDDELKVSVAHDLGITVERVGEMLQKCKDSRVFSKTSEPDIFEISTWLDWLYSDRSHKAEIISQFTTGIMELRFYDDDDNMIYSEGFAMDDSKVPFQNTPECP